MASEANHLRRLFAGIAIAVAGMAMIGGLLMTFASPADAQLFERRQRPSEGFNPFSIFTPLFQREPREMRPGRRVPAEPRQRRQYQQQAAPVDHSRAPPPQKSETTPSKQVVVLGASLSDWLAYGLEEIYSEQPEVGVVRKNQLLTGLTRFDSKEDTTWPQVARDFLKDKNPDVIVVLLGLEDRVAIRERAAAKPGDGETQPKRPATQSIEFRTDRWAEAYQKRIDDMIAALKSKGAPVIWVGLPAIRGTRSTSDMIYLNDLFRARAEKAGIVYVDVWEGFVDESGRFTTFGPDVEGQVRRLRTSEGVYFTKYGARKLAHYVEREIKRVMGTRLQLMAIPTPDDAGPPAVSPPGEPARPEAGPTVSLTNAASADELLGGGTRSGTADPTAARVLVKGTAIMPPSGRADNFFVTPAAAKAAAEAAAEAAAATALTAAPSAVTPEPEPEPVLAQEPKSEPKAEPKPEPKASAHSKPERPAKKPAANADPARPVRTAPTNRPAVQSERPVPPGDIRGVERRVPPGDFRAVERRRPAFDLFGLFR